MRLFLLITSVIISILLVISVVLAIKPELSEQLLSSKDNCNTSSYTTAQEYIEAALTVESKGNSNCAIKLWKKVVDKRPTDVSALANLAIRLSENEYYQESILYYKKAIKLGGGSSDLFAWYARSLRQLNQISSAIEWYYRTLSIEPELSDITAELSELLAMENLQYEALNILEGYEELTGHSKYFAARKTSLQAVLDEETASSQEKLFKVPKLYNNHFYISSRLSKNKKFRSKSFLVDTGASLLTINKSLLKKNKVNYKILKRSVRMMTADGEKVRAKLVRIPYFKLGPFELNNVKAISCKECQALIGQNILNNYDISTQRVNGVEFLTLKSREK